MTWHFPPRFLSGASRKAWLPIVGFVVGLILVSTLLATGILPGVPDAALKAVALYPAPQADSAPVTLFLQPPASTLQVSENEEAGQLLALQFANRSTGAEELGPVTAEPQNCFALRPLGQPVHALAAGDVRVLLYRLTAATHTPACEGQVALTLRYSYRAVPNLSAAKAPGSRPAGVAAPKPGNTPNPQAGKLAIPPSSGEGFVSTSPILLTTLTRLRAERFFRIASALLIPVLLAIGTFLIQQFQSQKADSQKARDQTLDVWKVLFPIVNGHMNDHYIQMVRRINDARAELSLAGGATNGRLVTASFMVLRTSQAVLDNKVGGFLFRTMPAESLCGDLSDYLWQYAREPLGDGWRHFDELADAIPRDEKVALAADKLDGLTSSPGPLQASLKVLQNTLVLDHRRDVLDRILTYLKQILEFENNRLWYPEWYSTPPVMNFSAFVFTGMDLPDDRRTMLESFVRQYRETVPEECRG